MAGQDRGVLPIGVWSTSNTRLIVTGSAGNYTVPATLSTSTACATGNNLFYYEQYTLTTNVTVPFPGPFHFANPYALSVTGAALLGHSST